tara:strand:+ start:3220 stop:3456 length:237 start_codon:yes stop_codon:yes gene_type:complete
MINTDKLELHIRRLHNRLLERPEYPLQMVSDIDLLKQDLRNEVNEINEQANNSKVPSELKKKAKELKDLYGRSQYYIN